MKKLIIISIITALFASGTALRAQDTQDYLGLPGDNLNLYAVMKLFQESKTLEEFERNLNDPANNINNLDLNNDDQVDYIRVMDNIDGDVHNIVLQVAVTPQENQDVAVFTVQRYSNGQVEIQLTGDDELYGKNYIIEPITDSTPNPGYTGQYVTSSPSEIAVWPVVRFIYLPGYRGWRSSWYWGYYPTYWHPWHPVSWHFYYGYHYNWYNVYYSHYRPSSYHRYTRWNDYYYTGHRSYSPEVYHRVQSGTYRTTYSHPDQRKDGDAMFAKSHPDQYRTIHSTSNKTTSRRSDPSVSNKPIFTESHRGSSTSNPRTTISRPNRQTNNNNNSRSNSMTNPVSDPSRGNNSGNGKNAETSRRTVTKTESTTVTSQPNTRSESSSSVSKNNRKGNQTGSTSTKSSTRQTRKESRSARSTKKETKSDSDNKDNNRR